ncbi:MAG: Txe/YoeB family addiction module toxin [Rhodocyclales bacterium]|nr:Txe/YoeB family addiction module toxin [Rhodocyclales bacterium]
MSWQLVYAKYALKDAKKLAASGLKPKALELLAILERDPLQNPPPFEKLVGDLAGAYSRRINIQHRLVYQIFPEKRTVRVLRMWTHYE